MKLYEIRNHFVDDYFVEHDYCYGIFRIKENAEKELKKILEHREKYYNNGKQIKIVVKETKD